MKNIDKKLIISIIITFIVAAAIGFYGGRYYEVRTFRSRFQQRIGSFPGGQNGTGRNRNGTGGFGNGGSNQPSNSGQPLQ